MVEVVDIQADFFRLIPSRFPPVQVFEGLVANDRLDEVAAAESRTNPRLAAEERLRGSVPNSHRLQNFNHAPFKYINPEGSVFFPPMRPALELADHRQTALAVAVPRRERFLRRTLEAPIGLDMRLLKTPVHGRFADLTAASPNLGFEERTKLVSDLPADIDGVVFRPAERPTHQCLAVLNGATLGYTLQSAHYRFWWDGARIATVYAFDDARPLNPEVFGQPEDALAA